MNPWWRRPNPERGGRGGAKRDSESRPAQARSSDAPAAIEDSLEPLPDVPEDDDFDNDEQEQDDAPRSKRQRSRRKRRRKNGTDKSTAVTVRSTASDESIAAALVDVEALAETLRALSIDIDEGSFAESLVCTEDGAINNAYANGNRHARLQRVLADAGFSIQETTGGTQGLRLRLAVDTVDLAHRADAGALLLAGNQETMELLAQRLAELERPLVTAHDHLTRTASADADESDADADDEIERDDARAEDDGADDRQAEADDDQRPDRRQRGRGRSPRRAPERSRERAEAAPRSRRRTSTSSTQTNGSAIALLDRAMETLIAGGPLVVWATLVRQTMLRLDPEFDERSAGYDGFADLLEAAANDGIIRLQDDERTGSQVVVGWARPKTS